MKEKRESHTLAVKAVDNSLHQSVMVKCAMRRTTVSAIGRALFKAWVEGRVTIDGDEDLQAVWRVDHAHLGLEN